MKAGLIGTGTIGRAVATGMARNGHSITVSRRNAENAAWLENEIPQVTAAENQDVVDNSEIVLIALTADVAVDALKALNFGDDQIVISLMSAFDLAQMAELVRPATPKAIMIPFPQIAAGGSPVLVLGDSAPVAHFLARPISSSASIIQKNWVFFFRLRLSSHLLLSWLNMQLPGSKAKPVVVKWLKNFCGC